MTMFSMDRANELIERHLDGLATDKEREELDALLAEHDEVAKAFVSASCRENLFHEYFNEQPPEAVAKVLSREKPLELPVEEIAEREAFAPRINYGKRPSSSARLAARRPQPRVQTSRSLNFWLTLAAAAIILIVLGSLGTSPTPRKPERTIAKDREPKRTAPVAPAPRRERPEIRKPRHPDGTPDTNVAEDNKPTVTPPPSLPREMPPPAHVVVEEPKDPEPGPVVVDMKPEPPADAPIVEEPELPEAIGQVVFVKASRANAGVLLRDGAEATPLKSGLTIRKGDRIRTGGTLNPNQPGKAWASIELWGGASVDLAAQTELHCEAYASSLLSYGLIYTHVIPDAKPNQSDADMLRSKPKMTFRSALGDTKVLGTRFDLIVDKRVVRVRMEEGRVALANPHGQRMVKTLQESEARQDKAPTKPKRIDADTLWRGGRERPEAKAVRDPVFISPAWEKGIALDEFNKDLRYRAGSLSKLTVFSTADTYNLGGRVLNRPSDRHGHMRFTVILPRTGRWYLWARMLYPGKGDFQRAQGRNNDPNSFWVKVDSGRNAILGNILGKRKNGPADQFGKWHWDGGGTKEEWRRPVALDLGELAAGPHEVLIQPREAHESQQYPISPRIDVLCFTDDRDYRPHDAAALKALRKKMRK